MSTTLFIAEQHRNERREDARAQVRAVYPHITDPQRIEDALALTWVLRGIRWVSYGMWSH